MHTRVGRAVSNQAAVSAKKLSEDDFTHHRRRNRLENTLTANKLFFFIVCFIVFIPTVNVWLCHGAEERLGLREETLAQRYAWLQLLLTAIRTRGNSSD